MSDLKITVGGDVLAEAGRRFIDAWHRAERGEDFCERHLAFENWNTLARVMTGKRAELIGYVRRNEVTSVRQLAAALGRDYSNVHADVKALAAEGLLDTSGGRIRADYDAIETRITF
jgi:predicted transcriptional regulator